MTNSKIRNFLAVLMILWGGAASEACTGIIRQAEDGAVIYARTLEFGYDLISFDLLVSPRGFQPDQKGTNEKSFWNNQLGYVGFNPFGLPLVADGINEKGLGAGAFYFPGYAEFEEVPESEKAHNISNIEFVSWVLANFATVDEVKKALERVKVYGDILQGWGFVPPLHYVVTDQTGASIVVEYVKGKQRIYENSLGVITNSPTYDWQTTNVRNYIGLTALNHPSLKINNQELSAFGQGSGAIGLPGDFTPPSRFIRALFFSNTASKGKNGKEGIKMAFTILNSFDIPRGVVKDVHNGKTVEEITQWTSAADLKNRKYYFHTHNNRAIRMVDLNKIQWNAKNIQSIKLSAPEEIQDLTTQLKPNLPPTP